jgi:hypothetical protein
MFVPIRHRAVTDETLAVSAEQISVGVAFELEVFGVGSQLNSVGAPLLSPCRELPRIAFCVRTNDSW